MMSTKTTKAALGVVIAVAIIVVLGLVRSPENSAARPSFRCPRDIIDVSASLPTVVGQADRLIPKGLNTRGHQYQIISAIWLAPVVPALPGASVLKRAAVRKCGQKIAERSWALAVQFPDLSPPAGAATVVFIAKTSRGWVLYG